MKHQFKPQQTNPELIDGVPVNGARFYGNKTRCEFCNRSLIDHTRLAICETCKKTSDCEVNSSGQLLCAICYEITLDALMISTAPKQSINAPIEPVTITSAEDIIADAKVIDAGIRSNGDFYNAKVIAIADIKRAIDNDESIPDEMKMLRLQEVLAERYNHLKQVVFNLDNSKHDAVIEQLAISQTLRDFGNALRTEIREKIRQADEQYQPEKPKVVKPKVTKPKASKNPIDMIVDAYMSMKPGITREQALDEIRKNKLI
jgi:hypothetical protein